MQLTNLALIIGCIVDSNDDIECTYAPILAEIINENHDIKDFISDDIIQAIEDIKSAYSDDFTFEFDGAEYRVIHNMAIWGIYVETIKSIVKDCYSDVINLDKIPSFICVSIDWEATAHQAYSDGYGHTFSSYDGSELLVNHHYIFRTN